MRTRSVIGTRCWGLAVAGSIWWLGHCQPVAGQSRGPGEPGAPGTARALKAGLYRELAGRGTNLVYSPSSVSAALGMVLAGARGETEREIRAVLDLPHDAGIPRPPGPAGPGEKSPLTVANSLWVDAGIRPAAAFRRILTDSFHAELRSAPFREHPADAAREVNSWVAAATRGGISELFPYGRGIEPSTRLLIANVVSFEAAWQTPFSKQATRDERFSVDDRHGVEVPMMKLAGRFPYAEDGDAQLVELRYEDPDYAFLVVLPRKGTALDGMERKLFGVFDPSSSLKPSESTVRVALPRFTLRRRIDLKGPLSRQGLPSAFRPGRADFSGMVDGDSRELAITAILQEALIEVDEAGSRAKAATGVSIGITAAPRAREVKEFRADRPFVFAIADLKNRAFLFAGRVVNPRDS